jgi:osmotically-inducible protein OsmY
MKFLLLLMFSIYAFAANSAFSKSDSKNLHSRLSADSQMKATPKQTELTRKLRAKILTDDQLSTKAHNIKIITMRSAITLKGSVSSLAEKIKIF